MTRKPREEVEGGIHHVYARGNGQQRIYLDDADRETYLALVGRVALRRHWRCLAYCLMDNHVHLLVETPEANLGLGMQCLHGGYAQTFNERHGRNGHLFQGRYGSVRMRGDEQLCATARYIALNPVNAGLCDRPERWPWSSHAATALGSTAPDWLDVARLLTFFESHGGDPRERYVWFVGSPL